MASAKSPPPLSDRDIQFQQYFTALAPSYAHLTSNTTYLIAQKALELCPVPTDSDALIHDNACGPGTATLAIIDSCQESGKHVPKIVATDYTPAMIENVPSHEKVEASVQDSQALPCPDNHFDYSICNISLANFTSPLLALQETHRTTKPDAPSIITHWKHFALSSLLHASLEAYHNSPQSPPPVAGKELTREGAIAEMMVEAGWERGKVQTYSVEVSSRDVEGAVEFLCGGYLPVVRGLKTEEERGQWRRSVEGVVRGVGEVRCEGWVVVGWK